MVRIGVVLIAVAIGSAATLEDLKWVGEARLLDMMQRWNAQ